MKQACDDAKDESDMPSGPLVDIVFEIEAELLRERNAVLEVARQERLRREAEQRGEVVDHAESGRPLDRDPGV